MTDQLTPDTAAGPETADAVAEPRPASAGPVPNHASTVVVPIANPDTATELLLLAAATVKRGTGRIIALTITVGENDSELDPDRDEGIEQIVENVRARDGRAEIELLYRPATTIARGILDTVRDENADLVVLGVSGATPGEVVIGGITEQVIRAADCDVLVYRHARDHDHDLSDLTGVIVGVDGLRESLVAARMAVILADGLNTATPPRIVHVKERDVSIDSAELIRAEVVAEVEGGGACPSAVVTAATPSEGLAKTVRPGELTVVGYHSRFDSSGIQMGSTTERVLNHMEGPVVAISRPRPAPGLRGRIDRLRRFLQPRLTKSEERSLIWQSRLAATLNTDFVVLCIVSAMIATFGLLLNSGAVIIGAMLVAPLMSPIVAFGTALVDGDLRTLRRSAQTVMVGTGLVAFTALVIGLVTGVGTPGTEILSRGSPSFTDAGVAAASGLIGGYAQARKGIPAALAGVAIAAALVPPICVFGLALTIDPRLAVGAGLLFVTNIACIAAASALVLVWLGLHLDSTGRAQRTYVRFTAPVVLVILGAIALFGLSTRGPDASGVEAIVVEELGDVEVVSTDILGPPGTITVTVRAADPPSAAALQRAVDRVEAEQGGSELRIAVQELLVGS